MNHTITLTNNQAYFLKHFLGGHTNADLNESIRNNIRNGSCLVNADIMLNLCSSKNSYDNTDINYHIYSLLDALVIETPKIKIKKYQYAYKINGTDTWDITSLMENFNPTNTLVYRLDFTMVED